MCASGFGDDGVGCTECELGYSKAAIGNAECSPCPGNTTTYVKGAWDVSMCTCLVGYVLREELCFEIPGGGAYDPKAGGVVWHVAGALGVSGVVTARDQANVGSALAEVLGVAPDTVAVQGMHGSRRLTTANTSDLEFVELGLRKVFADYRHQLGV